MLRVHGLTWVPRAPRANSADDRPTRCVRSGRRSRSTSSEGAIFLVDDDVVRT